MKIKLLTVVILLASLFTACSPTVSEYPIPEDTGDKLQMITDLNSYTLVYSDIADNITIDAMRSFKKAVKDKLGVDLKLTTDRLSPSDETLVGTKEILIGSTDRSESALDVALGLLGYVIAFENNRLIINGGSSKAVLDAVNFYIENYITDALYYPPTPYVYQKKYEIGDKLDMSMTADLTDTQISKWRADTDSRINFIRNTINIKTPKNAAVYYVSNNGDDNADGKTPETAWRSLEKVNETNLQVNSYVCFERGGLWRGILYGKQGVTYTAYGEGEKPRLYGSPFQGADPTLWKKTDTKNIWQIQMASQDVGTLVFNDGETYAIKCIIRTEANGETFNNTTGERFNSYRNLTADLHFYHDYKDTGILYIYSEQNPGERFSSIEFNDKGNVIYVQENNVTIDNLCIKYTGSHGVGAGTISGLTVKNCEFGWIGGSILSESVYGRNYATRYGNAVEIYGGCDGFTVTNNYIYQVYDAGITQQFELTDANKSVDQKNILYSRNVIEYCNFSIEYWLGNVSEINPSRIENFRIENNYMWYAGEGLCSQRPDKDCATHIQSWTSHENRTRDFTIKNNLMFSSVNALINIYSFRINPDGTNSMPIMSGNQFVGKKEQDFGRFSQGDKAITPYNYDIIKHLGEYSNGDVFWFTE